ncbi:hypothetical protein [Streptomyces collinus]|uniref:hypothetical protein n=1 Tax=Streptomyces collinus TaxID=42684 RepID=UPI0036B23892
MSAQIEAAETQLGLALRTRLRPFQDRYERAVRDSDTAVLTGLCAGTHGRCGAELRP